MRYCVLLLVVGLTCSAFAQQPAVQPTSATPPGAGQLDAQELITREFGKSFTVIPAIAPVVGDFDGDGQEDAAIVVTSTTPMVDEVEFKYKAIDPYDAYWGWGNPRDTIRFAGTNVGPARYIALLHNWRAPKEKLLIINLPFEKLMLSRVTVKKKPVTSLHVVEASDLESDVYWDGKKYKWVPSYMK